MLRPGQRSGQPWGQRRTGAGGMRSSPDHRRDPCQALSPPPAHLSPVPHLSVWP
ncbi:hypothetical protein ACFFX0_09200 [Citricoccus parietis]|uniref:Uncharacterized protein n=1 Tax=Citricoccus parietis TaxID=592307 RepID=A0ABV5FXF7_9MICC